MTVTGTDITADLVRDLLREHHPDLAERPLKLGALGWDNQVWRLGDDLAVRLPQGLSDNSRLPRDAMHALSPRRPQTPVRPVRGPEADTPRART